MAMATLEPAAAWFASPLAATTSAAADAVGVTDPSQTIVKIYDVSRLGLASYFLALIFVRLTHT